MRARIEARFTQNLARVRNLVVVYNGMAGPGAGRRPVHSSDVLRAATVLLHATMEDLLRSLELWKLPNAPAEALAKIPLAESEGKAEKFTLSGLGKFRGRTINDLIESSVREHLERSSYNNTGQVVAALSRIGVAAAQLEHHLPNIDPVMTRRHQIVHRADANENAGPGQHRAQSIGRATVNNWVDAIEAFGTQLLGLV